MDVVIGDIHGCFIELMELLEKVGPSPSDRIISVGDMIDRGPCSVEVVSFFMKENNAFALLGNHERKHLRYARGIMDPKNFGRNQKEALRQFDEIGGTEELVGGGYYLVTYREAIEFFGTLPMYMTIPGALVVHAGFMYEIPLYEQNEKILTGAGFQKENAPSKSNLFNWCDSYPQDADPVIFGHLGIGKAPWPLPQRKNLWPIDTGCCSGGYLTAVTVPDFKVFQVKSKQQCAARYKRK